VSSGAPHQCRLTPGNGNGSIRRLCLAEELVRTLDCIDLHGPTARRAGGCLRFDWRAGAVRARICTLGETQAMYAVIETGGKQYRVRPGQTVEVELLPAEPGGEIALERVLLVSTGESTLVGTPTVAGAVVTATVVREGRGEKIIVFKYHNKKRYR